MAVQKKTLSNRTVAALEVDRDTVFWDRDLTGFGIRVYPSGGKVFVAQARERTGDRLPKRVTVGRHGVLNADEARQRAALVIARIKAGGGPGAPAARRQAQRRPDSGRSGYAALPDDDVDQLNRRHIRSTHDAPSSSFSGSSRASQSIHPA